MIWGCVRARVEWRRRLCRHAIAVNERIEMQKRDRTLNLTVRARNAAHVLQFGHYRAVHRGSRSARILQILSDEPTHSFLFRSARALEMHIRRHAPLTMSCDGLATPRARITGIEHDHQP